MKVDILDRLTTTVLCGDGAMGTLLLDGGVPVGSCLEAVCLSDPDRIRRIHDDYIGAGAQIIQTNTSGANAVRLERFGLAERAAEINRAAARLARTAAKAKDVYVAGSVGPLDITANEAEATGIDRAQCFREQITALVDGGVDLIFFETFRDLEEMALAFGINDSVGAVEAICSFACGADGLLASGISVPDAFYELHGLGAKLVGVNCVNGPATTVELLQTLRPSRLSVAYPNAGCPIYEHGRFRYDARPDDFARTTHQMITCGVRVIGGCCGTTPSHVRAIAGAIASHSA